MPDLRNNYLISWRKMAQDLNTANTAKWLGGIWADNVGLCIKTNRFGTFKSVGGLEEGKWLMRRFKLWCYQTVIRYTMSQVPRRPSRAGKEQDNVGEPEQWARCLLRPPLPLHFPDLQIRSSSWIIHHRYIIIWPKARNRLIFNCPSRGRQCFRQVLRRFLCFAVLMAVQMT